MSVTTPPSVDTLPAAPDPGNRATYNTLAYPWSAALPTFSTQLQALANNVALNATDAASSATNAATQASNAATSATSAAASATAAGVTAGASAWVNGGTYALNAAAISQIDYQVYRKITASSVTSTDPKNDATNWVRAVDTTDKKTAVSASNIDLSASAYFSKTISGTTTFTVSNVPASGTVGSFILELTNGGSAMVNWWSGMKWASGTAPTLTAAGVDILGFYTFDGGTTWRGLVLAKDSK